MSRFTNSYILFCENVAEVNVLIKLATSISRSRNATHPTSVAKIGALYRSGVVLLSSHIEAYIKDLCEIAIEKIVTQKIDRGNLPTGFDYYFSRDLFDKIRDSERPEGIAEATKMLFSRDGFIWSSAKTYNSQLDSDIFLNDFANPKFKRIKSLFARFGYKSYEGDLGKLLGSDSPVCKNAIDQVVDKRNKIAHGDSTVKGAPKDLHELNLLTRRYCRATDVVVTRWFKTIGCILIS